MRCPYPTCGQMFNIFRDFFEPREEANGFRDEIMDEVLARLLPIFE